MRTQDAQQERSCGQEMSERTMTDASYRYAFNGKEKDVSGFGDQTHYDYGFRIYNPEIAKFLSVDPLTRSYPELTPYQFASDSPIANIDLDGLESYYAADGTHLGKYGESTEVRVIVDDEVAKDAAQLLISKEIDKGYFDHYLPAFSEKAHTTADAAARTWAFEYNPKTHIDKENRIDANRHRQEVEYGAFIGSLETKDENGDPITLFVAGETRSDASVDHGSVDIMKVRGAVLPGWKANHAVHSHPFIGNKTDNSEMFSEADKIFGGDKGLANKYGFIMYLATPGGVLKKYDPVTKEVVRIRTSIPAHPDSQYNYMGLPSFKGKTSQDREPIKYNPDEDGNY